MADNHPAKLYASIQSTVRAAVQRWRLSGAPRRLAARRFSIIGLGVVLLAVVGNGALSLTSGVAIMSLLLALAAWLPEGGEREARRGGLDRGFARSGAGEGGVWRTIIDAVPDVAIAFDSRNRVVHRNARALELYPDLKVGAPFGSMMRHPALMSALERVAGEGGTVTVDVEERVPIERRFQASVSLLHSPNLRELRGTPYTLLTLRDLTEHDRLAEMRADFIANASHELRTPLASLRGFVETLQGAARDDANARERFLGLMASQAQRMTRLIDDLLSLSRIEMNAHIPPRGIVDLGEVAAYVVQTLQPLADAASISVRLDSPQVPARIRGERDEIVQVVSNLVQNAIKYGHHGGNIRIVVERHDHPGSPVQCVVSVTDDGPGIAPEHLPRLTERFYRVSVQSSREKGGTGLGLAIVKHIVSRHRAELKIKSRVGEGSTFSVAFPTSDNNADKSIF